MDDVTIIIVPFLDKSKTPGIDLLKPDHGWIVTIIKAEGLSQQAKLVISDGTDKDVYLSLNNSEVYINFPHDLKSIGVRAKDNSLGRRISLKWKTLKGSGSSNLGETDEIEIPL